MFIYLIKLLIMISYVFIFLLVQSFAFSQITDVNININSRNIKNNKNQYLEKLKNDIEFYLLSCMVRQKTYFVTKEFCIKRVYRNKEAYQG